MDPRTEAGQMSRETEFELLKAAYEESVPVAKVHVMGDESLGAPSFLMERVEGETIARKLLRDEEYAEARQVMTGQLGGILARIHAVPVEKYLLAALPTLLPGKSPAETEVERFEVTYRAITPEPHPAFELAFRWLREHLPPATETTLVHGDYRIGNVIFGPEGVRAVLDWELAHVGDPMEDLGWLCAKAWRFGEKLPVAGVGTYDQLIEGYESAVEYLPSAGDVAGGREVNRETVRWWEVFGNLRWGVICIGQARRAMESPPKQGRAGSHLELLTIGRRTAETEWELLNLMEEE